jgi:cytochrome P450
MIITCQHAMHYNPSIFESPSKFDPDRFMDPNTVPRNAWRPFERGMRACMGQELAMDELRVVLLLTVRDFDFECVGVKPNSTPRACYTDLDLQLGDMVFQEVGLEAKPRAGMTIMKVSRRRDG